jgi:hypothetical protein
MNQVHILKPHFLKVSSMPQSPKLTLRIKFSEYNFVWVSHLPCLCYRSWPPQTSWFDDPAKTHSSSVHGILVTSVLIFSISIKHTNIKILYENLIHLSSTGHPTNNSTITGIAFDINKTARFSTRRQQQLPIFNLLLSIYKFLKCW